MIFSSMYFINYECGFFFFFFFFVDLLFWYVSFCCMDFNGQVLVEIEFMHSIQE